MPRGGRRPGAGRKPGPGKILERKTALERVEPEIRIVRASGAGQAVTAAMILASVDEQGLWIKLLTAQTTISTKEGLIHVPDWRTRLSAMMYLTDRRDGKPRQESEVAQNVDFKDTGARIAELLGLAAARARGELEPPGPPAPAG